MGALIYSKSIKYVVDLLYSESIEYIVDLLTMSWIYQIYGKFVKYIVNLLNLWQIAKYIVHSLNI